MIITSMRLKNFKMFQDIHIRDMPSFMVLVGANGTGKTTFFDALSFLRDCVRIDVQTACIRRGGIGEIVNCGMPNKPVEIEITFDMEIDEKSESCTYKLSVQAENAGVPQSISEKFYRHGKRKKLCFETDISQNMPYTDAYTACLYTSDLAQGMVKSFGDKIHIPTGVLGATFWGQLEGTVAKLFCDELDKWHFSNIQLPDIRQNSGNLRIVPHLPETGENIALHALYLMEHHTDTYLSIIAKMRKCIPSLENIETAVMEDKRVMLRFIDSPYTKGFTPDKVSDGTIKMFGYMLLLNDPEPYGVLCIEEPENHIFHSLMKPLVHEMREYINRGHGQIFVNTHDPNFLNYAGIEDVFWLEKNQGITKIKRALEDEEIAAYIKNGDKLGWLWEQRFFSGYPND